MQKKCKKICVCQKKAVLLHPLLKAKGRNAPSGGSRFPRLTGTPPGAIAQLVEQRTENPCVPSSILGGTTKRGLMASFLCQVARISLEFSAATLCRLLRAIFLSRNFRFSVAPQKRDPQGSLFCILCNRSITSVP